MYTSLEIRVERLKVKICQSRNEVGREAAKDASHVLKNLLAEKQEVNIIFAAAPSQNEFLKMLVQTDEIDWERVNAFHMDEYINLDENAPQGFGNFLKDRIFSKVKFKSVNLLNGNTKAKEESDRYSELLRKYPVDIVCMGIGENGHIAFNDPHVALFNDSELVKVVDLDIKSRKQQVNDGCFNNLYEVPLKALTLTIPALVSASHIFCIVPGKNKADAVTKTVKGDVDQSCPASILKTHPDVTLYVDMDSASGIVD